MSTVVRVQALFKKAGGTAKKAAPAKKGAKKAAPKSSGVKSRKGWLGEQEVVINLDKWYGPSRSLYLPGGLLDPADVPSYLDGSLAGDYGYDPLSLGTDSAQVDKYREYEVLHARWAMLGCAGIIIPEGLEANGADIHGGVWFESGAEMLNGGTMDYFAVPFGVVDNPLPLVVVAAVELGLLYFVETYRQSGEGPKGYAPGFGTFTESDFSGLDSLNPGGPFDPLGLADDPEVFAELKVKEIKNGRLAMMSFLGYIAQAAVTGEGPYANWAKHVSDPFGYNLLTVLSNEDRVPTL